eukprot:11188864-Lingulodinium_polyedra.AAC.1
MDNNTPVPGLAQPHHSSQTQPLAKGPRQQLQLPPRPRDEEIVHAPARLGAEVQILEQTPIEPGLLQPYLLLEHL